MKAMVTEELACHSPNAVSSRSETERAMLSDVLFLSPRMLVSVVSISLS